MSFEEKVDALANALAQMKTAQQQQGANAQALSAAVQRHEADIAEMKNTLNGIGDGIDAVTQKLDLLVTRFADALDIALVEPADNGITSDSRKAAAQGKSKPRRGMRTED